MSVSFFRKGEAIKQVVNRMIISNFVASKFVNSLSDDLVSIAKIIFTPQPLRAVGVLFSPMVSGWAGRRVGGRAGRRVGGRAAGKSLSGLYLRNRKV